MSERMNELQERLAAWSRRPTRRSAAVARAELLGQLESRRRRSAWRLAAALASIALVVTLGFALLRPAAPPEEPLVVALASAEPRSLLVYELSSGAKLYLSLGTSPAAREGKGTSERRP